MKTSVPLRLFTALLLIIGADMAGPATRAGAYSVTFNTMQYNVRFTHINSIKLMATNKGLLMQGLVMWRERSFVRVGVRG